MRWCIKLKRNKLWFDSSRIPVWLTAAARARMDRASRERKKESDSDAGERNLEDELYNWKPLSCAEY